MEKGRSEYTFQLSCNPEVANNVVQGFITGNNYELIQDEKEQYYRAGNSMQGYQYFNYNIANQTLTIYAWLKGITGEFKLEPAGISIPIMAYREKLNTLFQEIEKVNKGTTQQDTTPMNFDPNTGQPLQQNNMTNQVNQPTSTQNNTTNQVAQTFEAQNNERKEKMCEVGFYLSIFGLIISLLGVSYGAIVYLIDIFLAYQGLSTKKRKKGIISLVMTALSIIIIVIQLL